MSTNQTKRDELKAVASYQDGGFYVGGHAMARAMNILGGEYGDSDWGGLVDNATSREVDEAHRYLSQYICHMRANPMEKCPCCGQMRRVQVMKPNTYSNHAVDGRG